MTPESQPTATHPAPPSEAARILPPTVADLTEALVLFVETGSESDRDHVRRLVASLVDRGLGPADCAGAFWDTLGPLLVSVSDQERPLRLRRILAAETELWRLLDRAYRLERRAHRQMASAYTRKNLEISRILDSLPAYVFSKDAQCRYTAVNTSFCEALGLPRERILSHTDEDLFPAEIAHELSERDQEVLRSKVTLRQEGTVELNGEQHTLLITKAPLIDPDGRVTGLVGIGVDITQRMRIEREHSRLAAAVEAASDSIFVTDEEGTIQFVNASFEKLNQYSRDEIIGKKVSLLRSEVHDASFFEQMWSQLTAGGVWRGILTRRRKDGSTFETDQTTSPLQDEDGRISGYVTVARDVTEHKKLLDTLQQAVLVKSDFTSMVSHELRTPLCAIKEAIDLVEDGSAGPLNDHQTKFLRLAKRNVDRLHRLINDVLDFSRMERGAFRMQIAPHDLNAVVSG